MKKKDYLTKIERKNGDQEAATISASPSLDYIEGAKAKEIAKSLEEDLDLQKVKNESNQPDAKKLSKSLSRSRVSFLKSMFTLENHGLIDKIESSKIFIFYSESHRQILSVVIKQSLFPHIVANLFFIGVYYLNKTISLSCFMPALKCKCSFDQMPKKILVTVKEIFAQGNFFILPYYLVFSLENLRVTLYQKIAFFLMVPAIFIFLVVSDGEKPYPSFMKNVILFISFVFQLMLNVILNYKNKAVNLKSYFKITVLISVLTTSAYLFTNYQLVNLKKLLFRYEWGEIYFALVIILINKYNDVMMNYIIANFESVTCQ